MAEPHILPAVPHYTGRRVSTRNVVRRIDSVRAGFPYVLSGRYRAILGCALPASGILPCSGAGVARACTMRTISGAIISIATKDIVRFHKAPRTPLRDRARDGGLLANVGFTVVPAMP
ncbi:hypothetical protein MASR1M101_25770 [Gemmatimonas sp.]